MLTDEHVLYHSQPSVRHVIGWRELYWDFIDRHRDRLDGNPRMDMVLSSWERMDSGDRQTFRDGAADVQRHLAEGSL